MTEQQKNFAIARLNWWENVFLNALSNSSYVLCPPQSLAMIADKSLEEWEKRFPGPIEPEQKREKNARRNKA